ncbi:MAG: PQQ-binding-like beta-propeller repeat protein [Candidatus Bathyarchaeota archaeon]|nr:PQQ-binding-like beta-propeller repeat protein [Candidatus Bathyarchaeota archaeon]
MNEVEDRQRAEVFDALGHPTRIAILKALSGNSMGFADLKKAVGIDSSGHLQHHLNKLNGLIKTDEHGKYCLSDQGKDALLTVQTVEKAAVSESKEKEGKHATGAVSNKTFKTVVVLLAILLVISSSIAVFEYNQVSQLQAQMNELKEKLTTGTSVLWKRDFDINMADFAVDDGKAFIMTFGGDLYCLDQQDGRTLWSYNLGGYVTWTHAITVTENKVYAGSRGSVLTCFDEDDGTVLWRFKPNVTSSAASKSPPEFEVSNGSVLVNADGFYVLDAVTGSLLWDSSSYSGFYQALALADNRVLAASMVGAPDYVWFLVSFDANTGQRQWSTQIGHDVGSLVVAEDRIVLWGFYQNQTVFCIDETTGTLLWHFDVGSTVFHPTISGGLVLFGSGNGNFYALNAEDGTIEWTYNSKHTSASSTATAAPMVSDNKVFVGFEAGYVSCLALEDGKLVWSAPVLANVGSLETCDSELFVTSGAFIGVNNVGTNLYKINMDSGSIQWQKVFTYWMLPPACTSNRLYVAADLKVIAYS